MQNLLSNDYVVFYDNSSTSWSTPYCYCWNSSSYNGDNGVASTTNTWPGRAMTKLLSSDDTSYIYYYVVQFEPTSVIFNDGTTSDSQKITNQTYDLTYTTGGLYNNSATSNNTSEDTSGLVYTITSTTTLDNLNGTSSSSEESGSTSNKDTNPVTVTVSDDGTYYYQGVTYTLSNNTLTATSYDGNFAEVVIPSSINGYPVTAITSRAFNTEGTRGSLNSVIIGDNVTSIGSYAFSYCSNLASVTLGSSVATIAENAFEYCTSLKAIVFPSSVSSIGSHVFAGCTSLTTLVVGSGVIADYAFNECTGLKTLTIGSGVTSIGKGAFQGCTGITSVTTQTSSYTNCGSKWVFDNWYNYTKVTFTYPSDWDEIDTNSNSTADWMETPSSDESDNGWWIFAYNNATLVAVDSSGNSSDSSTGDSSGSEGGDGSGSSGGTGSGTTSTTTTSTVINGLVYQIMDGDDTYSLVSYTGTITTATIADEINGTEVNYVHAGALANCSTLETLTIGANITTIEELAFYGCSALTTITVNSDDAPTCGNDNVFYAVPSTVRMNVPFSWNDLATSGNWKEQTGWKALIPDGCTLYRYYDVTSVGYATLYSSSDVTIADGVTVYVAPSEDTSTSTITCSDITEDGVITKETGVLLKASASTYYFLDKNEYNDYSGDNIFTGTLETLTVGSDTYYTLGYAYDTTAQTTDTDDLGFYKFLDTTIHANRAFIDGNGTSAKGFSIVFNDDNGDTTGIATLPTTVTATNGAIYNLQGQRVSTPIRGNIYIQNGKKFIAK